MSHATVQTNSLHGTSNFVDIILPLPLQLLTYEVPLCYQKKIAIGSGVLVLLRQHKLFLAIVAALHNKAPTYPTKAISALLYPRLYTSEQLKFLQWVAAYYMTPIGKVLSIGLPKLLYTPYTISFQINTIAHSLEVWEKPIVDALQRQPLRYAEMVCLVEKKTIDKALSTLLQKAIIQATPTIAMDKMVYDGPYLTLSPSCMVDSAQPSKRLRSSKQQAIISYFLSIRDHIPYTTQAKLVEKGYAKSAVTALHKKGILSYHQPSFTLPLQPLDRLTDPQQQALMGIQQQFIHKAVVLLHGVVGSGKTALYMHLIQEVLQQQKKVLFLLPEISLVIHMVARIKQFWGPWLIVYHSKQSPQKRLKSWLAVRQPNAMLIVGTRSAIFLPFQDLQLIIVDEEHDIAYKHTDKTPTYHARDSSIILAKQHQAKVLLGSGTPAIESYYNARSGKFGLVTLSQRFTATPPSKFLFIDLIKEKKHKTMRENFSLTLLDALQKNSETGGQSIIFHNRRGYACYLLCNSCGWVPRCLTCAVSLTYHQEAGQLICHYCGYTTTPVAVCCSDRQLHNRGYGTEKVEETLQLFLPGQKIDRMDLDSIKSEAVCQSILEQVAFGSTAILVGTQMVSKGLDFANIRLVAVLDIDGLLHFPDFRSNEKCFQLITQLAGRAGRRHHPGQVFIQTTQPYHPLFYYLANGDYQGMYQAELAERKRFLYPPYARLIKLTLRCKNEIILQSGAITLKKALKKMFREKVMGPQQPLVGKVKSFFLLDFFIKIENKNFLLLQRKKYLLQALFQQIIRQGLYKNIELLLDIDPM